MSPNALRIATHALTALIGICTLILSYSDRK